MSESMITRKYHGNPGEIIIEYSVGQIDKGNTEVWIEYVSYGPNFDRVSDDPEEDAANRAASIKVFMITLRHSIEDLVNSGYTEFVQTVKIDDWELFLKKDSRWSVKNKFDEIGTITISCLLKNAVECVAIGFGILQNSTEYETLL